MPYIEGSRRTAIARGDQPANAGDLTYILYKAMVDALPPGYGYAQINVVLGAVEAAKLEFYRRMVGPYEDRAIMANGDIPVNASKR